MGNDVFFWLWVVGAGAVVAAAPGVLLFLWRISAQLDTLIALRTTERGREGADV